MKVCIGHKGKSFNKEVDIDVFVNKRIGDKVDGKDFGLSGYEFEITGGSDNAGFPMRKGINIPGRKRGLFSKTGVGVSVKRKGVKVRKNVRGHVISDQIAQVNLKVLKEGKDKLVSEEKKKE